MAEKKEKEKKPAKKATPKKSPKVVKAKEEEKLEEGQVLKLEPKLDDGPGKCDPPPQPPPKTSERAPDLFFRTETSFEETIVPTPIGSQRGGTFEDLALTLEEPTVARLCARGHLDFLAGFAVKTRDPKTILVVTLEEGFRGQIRKVTNVISVADLAKRMKLGTGNSTRAWLELPQTPLFQAKPIRGHGPDDVRLALWQGNHSVGLLVPEADGKSVGILPSISHPETGAWISGECSKVRVTLAAASKMFGFNAEQLKAFAALGRKKVERRLSRG